MLPDLDGFEVARRLRRLGHRFPIVFLTARDAPADAVQGLTVGGDDYIRKPFSLEEVVARVRSVLRRTRAMGDLGAAAVRATSSSTTTPMRSAAAASSSS